MKFSDGARAEYLSTLRALSLEEILARSKNCNLATIYDSDLLRMPSIRMINFIEAN